MADQLTPAADKSPDQIEREMQQTRDSLTEKVAALENQVVGTVQTAANTLTGTVESVKSLLTTAPETVTDTVKQAAAAVSETVKETFDISSRVRENPWAAVGISALLGSVVGYLSARGRTDHPFAGAAAAAPAATAYSSGTAATAPSTPGILDEFLGMLGDKAKEMARLALETVSASIKENIETGVPRLVNDAAARLTDPGAASAGYPDPFDARRSAV